MTGSPPIRRGRTREQKQTKRARFNHSGSSSDFNGSQEVDRSTPSFTYASSRCTDSRVAREQMNLAHHDLNVNSIWLKAGESDRFLLLEDTDTGDILIPLSRLKDLLGENYSRCLNTTDSRFVVKNERLDFGIYDSAQHVYWMWPFESPAHVKAVIRHNLKESTTGHIRLVPLPVVYSAMSKVLKDSKTKKRADVRLTPTFHDLHKAIDKALHDSSYSPVLHSSLPRVEDDSNHSSPRLFKGPHSFALTAEKYMTTQQVESRKKAEQRAQAACQKQQEESSGLADLRAEMSDVQNCMSDQAKKLEALEETLQQTKDMFQNFIQLFKSSMQTIEPGLTQVQSCLDMGHDWNGMLLTGRYSSDSTPKSQASQAFTLPAGDATPSQTNCNPYQFATIRRQHSMGCLPIPSAHCQPGAYPAVASKAHHLGFTGPQTPPGHISDLYIGRDKSSMRHVQVPTHSVSVPNSPFGHCPPRSISFSQLHDPQFMEQSGSVTPYTSMKPHGQYSLNLH